VTDPSKGEQSATRDVYTVQGNAKVGIVGPNAVAHNPVFYEAGGGPKEHGEEIDSEVLSEQEGGPHPGMAVEGDLHGIARPKERTSWDRTMTNLRDVLAALYPTVQDSITVADAAGLPRARIRFDPSATNNWHSILDEAIKHQNVPAVIEVARRDYPENEELKLAQRGDLMAIRGPQVGDEVPWQGPDDVDPLERIIGTQSTLVPINFLEIGLLRAKSVARVVNADGSRGSGFLVGDNLLVTNHHVLPDRDAARQAVIQFNYQQTIAGAEAPYEEYRTTPEDGFATSEEDDWTAVRLQGDPNQKWGRLDVQRVDVSKGNRVNIIQHPGGGPKQMSLYHNVVAYVDATRVQYLTDTLPGSSGSPVFDETWKLVALHHSGGWLPQPGSKQTYYRNEGIHINTVLDGVVSANLISGLE
jgi:V8-like Glu-specific endopeptidase